MLLKIFLSLIIKLNIKFIIKIILIIKYFCFVNDIILLYTIYNKKIGLYQFLTDIFYFISKIAIPGSTFPHFNLSV